MAASTAGSPCANLTSWMAAASARPAGTASGTRSLVASVTNERIVFASSVAEIRKRHRFVGRNAERKRTPRGDDETRNGWRAQRPEFGQPLPVETFDGQGEDRFAGSFDEDGPPALEFGKSAADAGMSSSAE